MMRNTFKPTQNNQKQHLRNVITLTNHLLGRADDKSLLTRGLGEDGTVVNYLKDDFTIPDPNFVFSRRTWGSLTKAVQVQSPGDGAYAFVIKTGRDIQAKVFCNRLENQSYQCEATFYQGEEKLGDTHFICKTTGHPFIA